MHTLKTKNTVLKTMTYLSNLRVSAGNDECLFSLVSSKGGSFVPPGKDEAIKWDDGYKLTIARVGKPAVTARLSPSDVDLLVSLLEKYQDCLEA